MSEKLTHDSLTPLVRALPDSVQETYFEWRGRRIRELRLYKSGHNSGVYSPEFVAECLQKLLALHAEVDKRLSLFSGDDYTDSE